MTQNSAYLTEIHHINGNGQDAGYVYCKRKYEEDSLTELLEQKILNAFYNKKCGFTSIFRGIE